MVFDFKVRDFLQTLKANKPPYECPYDGCGKIYKSYQGMRFHLYNFDHQTGTNITSDDVSGKTPASQKKGRWHHRSNKKQQSDEDILDTPRIPTREALTYAEAQRMVEVDIDGHTHRININEPMNIIIIDGKTNGFNLSKNELDGDQCKDISSVSEQVNCGGKNKGKTKNGKNSAKKKTQSTNQQLNKSSTAQNILKLPEASFRVIDYVAPDAPPKPSSYYRFIEKSTDELDEEVEYDMDEEDCAWLDLINSKRTDDRLAQVPPDTFELLMDRLEKESYFQSQNSGKELSPPIDEDAVCCICNDGECQNSNAILFCDMCDLAVHQECYGVPYIPEGQWLCRRCLQSPSRAVDCVLCPNKGGAFKQTDDNRWAHVVCALWIPEVCFANTVFLEPIDSIDNIPPARWKLSCYICKQRSIGACIQCHKANCYTAFHVTCAQQAGLFMKMEAIKEITPSGLQTSVRKAAYCHSHTPADENGTSLTGIYASEGDDDSCSSFTNKSSNLNPALEADFKEKMKKARKILAEKRSALPVVSIPTIPSDRLTSIASLINIPKRNQFLQRLLGYWTLKRQSRNGVPLLRRLQITYTGSRRGDGFNNDDEQALKIREELKEMQRLRQDLERARLLIELIRKREKTKRDLLKYYQLAVETQLQPYNKFLRHLLNLLEEKDTLNLFADPVDINEVPDYLNFIKHPMDFSTMRAKISRCEYKSLSQFEHDFNLIVENCIYYNEKDTVFYKVATKLKEQGKGIFKEARNKIESIGFNESTGVHSPPTCIDLPDNSICHVQEEQKKLEEKLKDLEVNLAKAHKSKSGGTKSKKIKMLTSSIADVKRQIGLLNPTSFGLDPPQLTKEPPPVVPLTKESFSITPKKGNAPSNGLRNGVVLSDSEATDICEISSNPSPLKPEGRRTYNSIIANTCFEEVEFQNSNRMDTSESPKNKFRGKNSRTPLKNRLQIEINHNSEINGEALSVNSQSNDAKNDKKSSNIPSPSSSSSSISLLSSKSVNNNLENGSQSRVASLKKSSVQKTSTADASTCTPANMFADSLIRERNVQVSHSSNKKRSAKNHGSNKSKRLATGSETIQSNNNTFPPVSLPQSDSFKIYRSNINSSSDSDVHSISSHTSASSGSSGSSGSSKSWSSSGSSYPSASSSGEVDGETKKSNRSSPRRPASRSSRSDISIESQHLIPLEPLDLVWAKCRGYPWYPALIVNPEMPKTGYFHNGVPIPVPPEDVLALKGNISLPVYLVLFFDAKRTWQWLPRNKLEPLGVNSSLDQAKLTESRKAADKKGVKKAFEKAILHRCRVTGESTDLSGDSSNDDS